MTDRRALLIVSAALVAQSLYMWLGGDSAPTRPATKWRWLPEVTDAEELIDRRDALMADPVWIEAHPCTAASLYAIERWRHFPRNNLAYPGGVSD